MSTFHQFKRVEFDQDNQPQVVTVVLEQISMYHYRPACEESERRWRSDTVFVDKLIDNNWIKGERPDREVLEVALNEQIAECNSLTRYFERMVSRRQNLRKVLYRSSNVSKVSKVSKTNKV